MEADRLQIERCGVAWDVSDVKPPEELILETIKLLKADGVLANPTQEQSEVAASKSGLKKWLVDNGVGLAGLALSLAQLMSS